MAKDEKKAGLLRTRIFIVIFFGVAVLLSITTILGTWEEQREGVVDPPAIDTAAHSATSQPAAPTAAQQPKP